MLLEKLFSRLRSLGFPVSDDTSRCELRRTYAGSNQLSAGACRWFILGLNCQMCGYEPLTDTLKGPILVSYCERNSAWIVDPHTGSEDKYIVRGP